MRRHALGLLVATALVALGASARADIYRWTDSDGAVHYATDASAIPREYRDGAQLIERPAPRRVVRRPPAAPAPPEPGEAPSEVAPSAATPAEAAPANEAPPIAAPSTTTPPSAAPSTAAPELAPPDMAAPPDAAPLAPLPGPPRVRALPPGDPRAEEVAELEAQIAKDREVLRKVISTPRWDSAELAQDPQIREIAERLPRLQAELDALRREPAP